MTKRQKQIFLGLCVAWFLFALTFTPSGDDFARLFIRRYNIPRIFTVIPVHYLTLNGRVLGNFVSFILLEPLWLRSLVKTLSVAIISHSIWKLGKIKSTAGLVTIFFLVTAIPLAVHTQVYPWSAGFFNYAFPLVPLSWYAARMSDEKKPRGAVALLVGLCCTLFVEHVTVFLLVVSAGILVLRWKKRIHPAWLPFAIGVFLGAVIMFSSPVYFQVVEGADTYRTVPSDGSHLLRQMEKNMRQMGPYILAWQGALPYLLFGAGICLLKKNRDRLLWSGLFLVLALFFVSFRDRSLFMLYMDTHPLRMTVLALALHFGLWLFLLVQMGARVAPTDRTIFTGGLVAWMFLFAPLAVVDPIGPRNFLAGTVALILVVAILLKQAGAFRFKYTGRLAAVFLLVLLVWRGSAHWENTRVYLERDRMIRAAMEKGQTTIRIPPLPRPDYVHGGQNEKLDNLYLYKKVGDITFLIEGEEE